MENSRTAFEKVLTRLRQYQIKPDKNLGQHFLIDDAIIGQMAATVLPERLVIEVGAGVGQLTEVLAARAKKVIAIEIDPRFEPALKDVAKRFPNVEVVIADAIKIDFKKYGVTPHIVSSLPFHISEPFFQKLAANSIKTATLLVGDRLARKIAAPNGKSPNFGLLTVLVQTFFRQRVLGLVAKKSFSPVPRTDATLISLIPKEEQEIRENKRDFLFRRLILTAGQSPLIKNSLKEALIEKAGLLTQNRARAQIMAMGLPNKILEKPFPQLNNSELRSLFVALS